MSCQICRAYLHDFLITGIPEGIPLKKDLRKQVLPRISWLFADWIHRTADRIEENHFQKATSLASRIAKRGRKDIEYEYITSTAAFNFLKYEVSWLEKEEEYIALLLMEHGLLKGKNIFRLVSITKDYIRYITIRAMYILKELHEDHQESKGLLTNLDHILPKKDTKIEKEDTLYDRDDDYQKEILDEPDDGLYF